jgi:hypothetical protein
MDKKTRTSKPAPTTSPYEIYRGTPAWKILDKAIADLVENTDIVEQTRRDYIVGYICKKLQRVLPKVDGECSTLRRK